MRPFLRHSIQYSDYPLPFRMHVRELLAVIIDHLSMNISNLLGPNGEVNHKVKYPLTITLSIEQQDDFPEYKLTAEVSDDGEWT